MSNPMKIIICAGAIALALSAIHSPATATGFKFSSTDQTPPAEVEASPNNGTARVATQLRCGQGELSEYPEKVFVSYLMKSDYLSERVYLEKAYVCVKDNSVDTEEGLRDLFSRLTRDSRKQVIAPMMIQRLRN
jgi:hypothetical protein